MFGYTETQNIRNRRLAEPSFVDHIGRKLIQGSGTCRFMCSICRAQFSSQDTAMVHIAMKHRNQISPDSDEELDKNGLYLLGFLSGFQNASSLQVEQAEISYAAFVGRALEIEKEKVAQLQADNAVLRSVAQEMTQELSCVRCHDKRRTVAFQCGHLSFCESCGINEQQCGVCGTYKLVVTNLMNTSKPESVTGVVDIQPYDAEKEINSGRSRMSINCQEHRQCYPVAQ